MFICVVIVLLNGLRKRKCDFLVVTVECTRAKASLEANRKEKCARASFDELKKYKYPEK